MISEVKVGLADTAIVEVEVRSMLDPAMRQLVGVLQRLFHCVEEAVKGIEQPATVERAKVCTPNPVVILKLSPVAVVEVAKVCTEVVSPFNDVSPPPDPASPPQKNCPVEDEQSTLSATAEQPANAVPKSLVIVRAPVEDAFVKQSCPPTVKAPVVDAVVKYVCPETVRSVAEAVVRVDCPVAVRFVVKRLPVVSPPVEDASVKQRVGTVRALVEDARLKVRLDVEAFVVKRFVEVLLVTTEEEAQMFCVKRLRKRRALVPRERVISVVGRISANVLIVLQKKDAPVTEREEEARKDPDT